MAVKPIISEIKQIAKILSAVTAVHGYAISLKHKQMFNASALTET